MHYVSKKTARLYALISIALLTGSGCAGHSKKNSGSSAASQPGESNTVATVGGFDVAAIGKGDIQAIQQAIGKNADVNGADPEGFTPLMWASLDGQTDIVKLFLDKGANVNAKDKYGRTALIEAAFRQDNPVVPLLLAKGVDVNAKDDQGNTALTIAAREQNSSVVAELKEAGAK